MPEPADGLGFDCGEVVAGEADGEGVDGVLVGFERTLEGRFGFV